MQPERRSRQLIKGCRKLHCEFGHVGGGVGWWRKGGGGRGITDNASILSSFGFLKRREPGPRSAATLRHVLLPLQGFSQAASNINNPGLFCFFSAPSTSHTLLAETPAQASQRCPQNFDTFKARPKK